MAPNMHARWGVEVPSVRPSMNLARGPLVIRAEAKTQALEERNHRSDQRWGKPPNATLCSPSEPQTVRKEMHPDFRGWQMGLGRKLRRNADSVIWGVHTCCAGPAAAHPSRPTCLRNYDMHVWHGHVATQAHLGLAVAVVAVRGRAGQKYEVARCSEAARQIRG